MTQLVELYNEMVEEKAHGHVMTVLKETCCETTARDHGVSVCLLFFSYRQMAVKSFKLGGKYGRDGACSYTAFISSMSVHVYSKRTDEYETEQYQ